MGGTSTTTSENAAAVTISAPAAASTQVHHKVALHTLIGGVVGAFALGIVVVAGFLYWQHRRRQKRKKARNAIANPDSMPHLLDSTQTQDPNRIHELENNHPPSTHELSSPDTPIAPPPEYSLTEHMKDKDGAEAELGSAAEFAELPGGDVPRAELWSGKKWSIRRKRAELGSGSSARSWRKGDDRGA